MSVINVKISQGCEYPRSYHISDGLYGLLSSARFDPFVKYLPKLLEVRLVASSVAIIVTLIAIIATKSGNFR